MASNFEQAIAFVRAKFDEVRAERGHGAVLEDRWLIGRNAIETHKSIPYIGWLRLDGKHDRPTGKNPIRDGSLSVSQRYQSTHSVRAVICGESDEATEWMWFDLLEAEHRALGSHELPGPFRWITQEEGGAGLVLAGAEVVFQDFVWPMVVPSTIDTLVVPTSTEHECSLIP